MTTNVALMMLRNEKRKQKNRFKEEALSIAIEALKKEEDSYWIDGIVNDECMKCGGHGSKYWGYCSHCGRRMVNVV